jgi:uracil-DNA glycosylase family 4
MEEENSNEIAKNIKHSNDLFKEIKKQVHFPTTILHPDEQIEKRGFFPVCRGTIDGTTEIKKRILVVGQDFGRMEDYQKAKLNGENTDTVPTWKHIKPMLANLGIDLKECFFTNYLMGLRTKTKTNNGISPGFYDEKYIQDCLAFFNFQVEQVKPELIIFLGKYSYFLSKNISDRHVINKSSYLKEIIEENKFHPKFKLNGKTIPCIYLIHPSKWPLNVKNGNWPMNYENELKKVSS